MPARRPPSPAKVRLARTVFGLGWASATAVLLTGPAYRRGYIDVGGIQTIFGLGASAALAAIIGGLALALLLPARDPRSTLLATTVGWLFRAAVCCAFAATLAFLAAHAVPGLGLGLEPARLLGWAGLSALLSVVLGILWAAVQPAGTSRPGLLSSLMGVAMGIAAAYVPITWKMAADTYPRINDISTDTVRPPPYVTLARPGGNAGNGAGYPAATTAAAQRAGYPDIGPLTLKQPPDAVLARVERVARAMGWEVVAHDAAQGRLEAVATSAWFGFKDDIVVRLTAVAGGTRVDVRSRSRVGISDLGANAARIRAFMAQLRQAE